MIQKPTYEELEKRVQELEPYEAFYRLSVNNSNGMITEHDISMFLDNIQAAVVIHGPDTKIIQSNKLAQNLLGLSKDQMLGKEAIDSSWCFFDENGIILPIDRYPVNQVIATKTKLTTISFTVKKADNNKGLVDVLVSAAPVFDLNGDIALVIVTFMDITERKLAEKEREELIIKLHKAIEQIEKLSGVLPICASCKDIRDKKGNWNKIESYIKKHSKADFSHGICPDCLEKLHGHEEWYIQAKPRRENKKS